MKKRGKPVSLPAKLSSVPPAPPPPQMKASKVDYKSKNEINYDAESMISMMSNDDFGNEEKTEALFKFNPPQDDFGYEKKTEAIDIFNFKNNAPPPQKTLSQLLSADILNEGKKALKDVRKETRKGATITRDALVSSASKHGHLPLASALDAVVGFSRIGDVTVLDFSGTEQLTDSFFYILINRKVELNRAERICLNGCFNLTDTGIDWMTDALKTIQVVELNACHKLTERSLYLIIQRWALSVEMISMKGTNVGLVPPGYEVDLQLNGCPLLSPTEKLFIDLNTEKRGASKAPAYFSSDTYKIIILTDDVLEWSPMAIMMGEQNIKNQKQFKVQKLTSKLDKKSRHSVFEMPMKSGFSELVMSEGSIVAVPYIIHGTDLDDDYATEIGMTLSKLITKHPQCVFVLMGMSEEPCLETAGRYGNVILGNLSKQARNLSKEINSSITQQNVAVLDGLTYSHQKILASALEKSKQLDSLKDKKEPLVLQACVCINKEPLVAMATVIKEASDALTRRFPWLFMNIQKELKETFGDLEKMNKDLTSIEKIHEEFGLAAKFAEEPSNSTFTQKIFSLMNTRGSALFYPEIEGLPVITDFTFLEKIFNSIVTNKGPTKASWRFLGTNVSCWTRGDIEALCPIKSVVPLLISLLEHYGILFKMPRDCWTTDLKDTYAYVAYNSLPFYPIVDTEDLWPDNVPERDSQIERFFHFHPSVNHSFFTSLFREFQRIGGVKLAWKTGIIIRKGPITILLEMLKNHEDQPILFLGVRLLDGKMSSSTFSTMQWATFKNYKTIVWQMLLEQNLFAVEYIACPNCIPSKNRYKIVNSTATQMYMIPERYCRLQSIVQSDIVCKNDGTSIKTETLLGPKHLEVKHLVPSHYYLGCLPSYSMSSRCMFCENCAADGATCEGNLENGKTSWTCSCELVGQMCDECGLCQRCITFLSSKSTWVYPAFQGNGSALTLTSSQSPHIIPHELSPNYTPRLEIYLLQGAHIDLCFQIGTTSLVYNTKDGCITESMLDKVKDTKSDPNWKCHVGYNVSVQLRFSEDDFDDMEMVFTVQGTVIHVYRCSSQSCQASVKAYFRSNLVIYLPTLKIAPKQGVNDLGEKLYCMPAEYNLLPASIEASVVKMKDAVGDALFQAGGINFSGASLITLPETIDMATLQIPTFDKLHHAERPTNQLLCYTRSKISDVLVQGITAAPESWSVYRMIHLVDSPGFHLKRKGQDMLESNSTLLLWAWHFLMKMQAKIELPENCKNLLQLSAEEMQDKNNMLKIQTGLRDLIDLGHWRLLIGLDLDTMRQEMTNTEQLLVQTEHIQSIVEWNAEKTGLRKVQSHFNEDSSIYLCPGHHASMRIEEGLTEVMPEIYGDYAKFLLSVDIPANQLKDLPEKMFESLPNLTEFDCSRNFISKLPSSIGSCKKLYSLALPENNLTDLPETLKNCEELWRLDITSNMMEKIPPVVTQLTPLKKLYAGGMFLTSLPEDIGNLVNLEKLSLNGNCLTSLPKSFGKLKSLTDLGLSGVPWYGNLKAGKTMKFNEFAKRLRTWELDRWMRANNMDMKKFFDTFDVDNNEFLDVNELNRMNAALFNMFPRFGYKGAQPPEDDTPSGFPMEILECTNLEYLSMFYQGFVSIPAEIGNLQELRILNISHNPNLLAVPAELSTISSLTRLEMIECPMLKTPPREIRAKGFATIFGYLRRMLSGSQVCKRTKLMLVGLGGAGKTSLVNSLLSKDGKAQLTQAEAITDGIDISTWTVRRADEAITYSVWDFAGQTVYYNTHQFFLSNRAVYLLLWNVRLGFEHAGLDFWLSSISVQAPNAPIFVVGSHIDQVSKFELPINEMKARYKQIAGFHFVSSYTGQGIKELQDKLFEVTLQEKYMGEQIPEVWLTLESNVISCRSTKDVIEYTELEQLANNSGLFDKTEIYQAVQFLHELGSLQHFTTETLKSKVVVNPQWIVDVMSCVVSVKNSPIKDGRLSHKDIAVIWKDYPTELHAWLLHLTEAYDLTFPLDNEPVNLVPCLLPEKAPEFSLPDVEKDSPIKRNKMIYKFDYLPAGLFNRAQVRLHQLSDSAHIWKRGSFLNKNGHVALIQQTRDSELHVIVQGPRPENVLFLIHEVFEGLISESFAGVKYDFKIPCPDCLKLVIKDAHMFYASTIRRALEWKAPFLQCVKNFHTVSCIDLLASMPPDNHSDFDLHLVQSVRSLRDLRKDLAADLFISYCQKNAPEKRGSVIHPATVYEDLVNYGYKCWFPEMGKKFTMEEMATALLDAAVFVVFISKEYVNDEACVNTFKYARLTLRKPMVVIACGDGYEWKQSKLGILLSDEVYVNMINAKKDVYKSKFDELVAALGNRTNKEIGVKKAPTCFFSYSWVNSKRAVELGTRSINQAIGYGDPREIKDYLEGQGIKCWIDIERVGQNGLFDDIADGLLSAKVMIMCVSDEYAASATCMMEFRYAANVLKLPIIIAIVGRGNKWRSMEVGALSLNFPIVSFQEKSETAYTRLLDLVQDVLKRDEDEDKDGRSEKSSASKDLSFQELFELVQRKLLRQLASYAEQHDVGVYPRVFALDFLKTEQEETLEVDENKDGDSKPNVDKEDEPETPKKKMLRRLESTDRKKSEMKTLFRLQRYCVHVLCEHDSGWHSVSEPISLVPDFGETMLDKFCPYLARITAVMKYNRHLRLACMNDEIGEDFMKWLEESPLAAESDYQDVYREFREVVMSADSKKVMGKLDRCRLPNGRTMWLCEKHQSSMKVTVLSTEEAAINVDFDATESLELKMLDALRSGDFTAYTQKFTSSNRASRQPDGVETQKASMYSENYDLLPDKKAQVPMKSKVAHKGEANQSGEGDSLHGKKKSKRKTPLKPSDFLEDDVDDHDNTISYYEADSTVDRSVKYQSKMIEKEAEYSNNSNNAKDKEDVGEKKVNEKPPVEYKVKSSSKQPTKERSRVQPEGSIGQSESKTRPASKSQPRANKTPSKSAPTDKQGAEGGKPKSKACSMM